MHVFAWKKNIPNACRAPGTNLDSRVEDMSLTRSQKANKLANESERSFYFFVLWFCTMKLKICLFRCAASCVVGFSGCGAWGVYRSYCNCSVLVLHACACACSDLRACLDFTQADFSKTKPRQIKVTFIIVCLRK